MSVFGRFKLSQQQIQEIIQQLKGSKAEMDNCLSDYAIGCWELFRVRETQNIQILYWMRLIKLNDNDYEIQFIREVQFS